MNSTVQHPEDSGIDDTTEAVSRTSVSARVSNIQDQAVHVEGMEDWAKQNFLSFDGGGIRGYYSLLHLQYLMRHVKDEEVRLGSNHSFSPCIEPRDSSESTSQEARFLPCHYFDYISGTSTGGLITIMLATPRMSVQDCLAEYKNLAGSVFGQPRHIHQAGHLGVLPIRKNKYATTKLENAIKDVMRRKGEEAYDHDDAMQFRTPKGLCRAIVLANRDVMGNSPGLLNQLWLFRSCDNFRVRDEGNQGPLNPGRGTNFAAWKVARAATAAKMYFKPLEIALDDGEVIHGRRRTRSRAFTSGARTETDNRTGMRHAERKSALLSDAGFSRVNNPSVEVRKELESIFRDGPKKLANWVSIGTARKSPPGDTSNLTAILKRAVAEVGKPRNGARNDGTRSGSGKSTKRL